MSRASVLGALLLGLCGTPLGCELITGDVSHDFAGAGGVPADGGDAGDSASKGGSVPSGGGKGGNGSGAAAGSPDSGAGGAGESGMTGDSGAAGMSGSCVPVSDDNPCTSDSCVNGAPAHPPTTAGTPCSSGGTLCDGAGACVACLAAADCPGTDNGCQTRTCKVGVCGFDFVAQGVLLATQTAGDCKQARCDGAGVIKQVTDDTDVPNDSNACTSDVCSSGSPSNPPKTTGTGCGTNLVCNSAAVCVGCNVAADCPGSNDECKTRTCVNNQCGVSFAAIGTAVAAQTAGNCLKATCDGAGSVTNIADNADVPADDGNGCTDETCAVGVPQHPAKTNGVSCSDGNACTTGDTCQSGACASGTAVTCTALDQCHSVGTCSTSTGLCSNPLKSVGSGCTQGGGSVCSATGSCVQCVVASDCTGTDTECQVRTCTNNSCGVSNTAPGTATASQTAGDCLENECDGSGQSAAVAHDADVPADDGNQCTSEICNGGVGSHPRLAAGSACNQGGGSVCDSSGGCTNAAVLSTSPAESVSVQPDTAIAVTFNVPMTPSTLTGQVTAGACTGSVQVSSDEFATCVGFSSAAALMSAGNTVATFSPAALLLPATNYKIRVTTAAQSAASSALAAQFTQVFGFATP